MFFILSNISTSGMQSLIEALKSRKISKRVARLIIRKLRRKGLPVDNELLELAY